LKSDNVPPAETETGPLNQPRNFWLAWAKEIRALTPVAAAKRRHKAKVCFFNRFPKNWNDLFLHARKMGDG
jgi:hypothetical protein